MTGTVLDRIPYARFLGLAATLNGDNLVVTMPFSDHLVGNPMLPALHGGSTAALLELTAVAEVARRFPDSRLPRPINVTVSYLRSGRPIATHAKAVIRRAGRRVASVEVQAWQDDETQPIATLHAHFLMSPE